MPANNRTPAESSTTAATCVFDHALITLPSQEFTSLKTFFHDSKNSDSCGVTWHDDSSGQKAFMTFPDNGYLEVWDESKFSRYGYQDACRSESKEFIESVAQHYKVESGKWPKLIVAGRTGWTGDPKGGMFFLWQSNHQVENGKDGIRQILEAVPALASGRIDESFAHDYELANMKVNVDSDGKGLSAIDPSGVKRLVVASRKLIGNGFIALQFSRSSSDSGEFEIQPAGEGLPRMSLKLTPKSGVLVFRGDLFEKTSDLLHP